MSSADPLYMVLFRQSPLLNFRSNFVTFSGWQIESAVDLALITFLSIVAGFARHILSTARWRMEWTGATNVSPPAKKLTTLLRLFAILLWTGQSLLGCLIILLVNTLHGCVFSGVAVGSAVGYWLAGTGCFGMSSGSCPGGEALLWA